MSEERVPRARARAAGAQSRPTNWDGHYQLVFAREVLDATIAPRHPGDHTPRLLIQKSMRTPGGGSSGGGGHDGGSGECVRGRLLMSPWTAFKGVFPMHGTYFFQNEVFEDEAVGEVQLGPRHHRSLR